MMENAWPMEVGSPKSEVGSRKSEVRSRKLEVRRWKSEVGSWKLEVRSLLKTYLGLRTSVFRTKPTLQPATINEQPTNKKAIFKRWPCV